MLRLHGVEVDDSDANRWAVAPGPVAAVRPRHRARPVQRGAVPRAGRGDRRPGDGHRLAGARPRSPATSCAQILALMGCEVTLADGALTVVGPERLSGVDLDLHDVGELTPAVAALCALADSPSHLRGIAHIRGHETDRLTALATELGRLGADVTEREDGLSIRPAPLHGGVVPHLRRPPDGPRRRHPRPRRRRRPGRGHRHDRQDLPRLRRRVEPRGAREARRDHWSLLRSRPRALRAPPAPHPPAHEGPARPTTTRSTPAS